ncbi:MAG: RNA methyltransferase [Lachnospiraceae bacterium]|nr:RNA methyltransferase [Lachnospiraceae bacterium]
MQIRKDIIMQIITSKDNEIIKNIRKLNVKKYRDEMDQYIIEGTKLLEEAIKEKAKIEKIIVCYDCVKNNQFESSLLYEIAKHDCLYVNQNVFDNITDVKNPQGILAIISKSSKEQSINYNEDIIVILDGVQDPGNIGTILRTLDAIGVKQIILSKGSADVYNPKVVRATMGAIFRVNAIESPNLVETIKQIKANKFEVIASSLDTQESIYNVKFNKKAIVIGNEANGVSAEVLKSSDKKIKIPMLGKAESLNAGVAASIILYEYVRQKLNS